MAESSSSDKWGGKLVDEATAVNEQTYNDGGAINEEANYWLNVANQYAAQKKRIESDIAEAQRRGDSAYIQQLAQQLQKANKGFNEAMNNYRLALNSPKSRHSSPESGGKSDVSVVASSSSSGSGENSAVADSTDSSNSVSIGEKLGLDDTDEHHEDPAASVTSNEGPKIKVSHLEVEREGDSWTTCLNYVMNNNKKFTLKNLGMHMTARMLSNMVQDNVNKHTSIQLGSVSGAFDVAASSRVGIVPEKLMDLYNQYNFKKEFFEKGAVTDFYFGSKLGMDFSKDSIDDFITKYTDQNSSLRLGEANVLNPPFQFNELDDIRSDFRRPKLGRLFCEEIYDYNLPICFFQPGIINIDTAAIGLYNSLINKRTMAYQQYLRDEPGGTFEKARNLIGGVLHTGISWLSKQVMDLGRWYSWTPSVYRYLRMVNEMMEELGVWMGLFKKDFYDEHDVTKLKETQYESLKQAVIQQGNELKAKLESLASSVWYDVKNAWKNKDQIIADAKQALKDKGEDVKNRLTLNNVTDTIKGVGDTFLKVALNGLGGAINDLELTGSKDAPEDDTLGSAEDDELVGGFNHYMANDVYPDFRLSALNVLPHYLDIKGSKSSTSNDDDQGENSEDILSKTIPFAIDKGASSSESFSNSYQQHPLVEQYNQQYENANQANLVGTGGDIFAQTNASINEGLSGDIISSGLGAVKDSISGAINGAVSGLAGNALNYAKNKIFENVIKEAAANGLTGEAGMVTAGAGRFVLPEVWSDSSFDKSYSMSMKLRCPYGHRLFIYENQLIPLAFLLGMTAPRAVGVQMYTNPFYIKMYCKGLFSVPLGAITSLTISHGDGENDRTADGFFRTMSISISVKDMLPNLAVGLNAGYTGIMKAANPGMSNYLLTLANIDFVDKAMWEQDYQDATFNYMGYDTMEDSNVDPKEILSLSQNNGSVKVMTAALDNFAKSNSAGPYVKQNPEAY